MFGCYGDSLRHEVVCFLWRPSLWPSRFLAISMARNCIRTTATIRASTVRLVHINVMFFFILIYLRSNAQHVITTYVYQYRLLIPDGIHLFLTRFERWEARPIRICWVLSKRASHAIFITSLVWCGPGSNPRHTSHKANTLPLSHHCGNVLPYMYTLVLLLNYAT